MWHSVLLLMVMQPLVPLGAELASASIAAPKPVKVEPVNVVAPAPDIGMAVLAETLGAGAGSILGLGAFVAANSIAGAQNNGTVESAERSQAVALASLALPAVFAGAAAGTGGLVTGSDTALGAAVTTTATTSVGMVGGALVGAGLELAMGGGYPFGPIVGILLGGVAGTLGGAVAGPSVYAMLDERMNKQEVE